MKNDGGPAFPSVGQDTTQYNAFVQDGMSLRDYFAIKVLAGMVAHSGRYGEGYEGEAAHQAYAHADAMLAERERD